VLTLLALGVLIIFYAGVLLTGKFNLDLALNIAPENPENSRWFPFGFKGVALALPYAIWLYLAIEQLHSPPRRRLMSKRTCLRESYSDC
jgi:ethanolamine permease